MASVAEELTSQAEELQHSISYFRTGDEEEDDSKDSEKVRRIESK
jgi:hypothetical protein